MFVCRMHSEAAQRESVKMRPFEQCPVCGGELVEKDREREEAPKATANLIDRLLVHPLRVKGFRPLSREEIYAR